MKKFNLLFILALLASCQKDFECEKARLSVVNIGKDTIYYCWNCYHSYEEKLPPGDTASTYFYDIYYDWDWSGIEESTGSALFSSSSGNYELPISTCKETYYIE